MSALEHNLALAEHGRLPLFHRIWRSLTRRMYRTVDIPAEPILDGAFWDCADALSEFLSDKCKDPINPARHEFRRSTGYFARFALFSLAMQVGCS